MWIDATQTNQNNMLIHWLQKEACVLGGTPMNIVIHFGFMYTMVQQDTKVKVFYKQNQEYTAE